MMDLREDGTLPTDDPVVLPRVVVAAGLIPVLVRHDIVLRLEEGTARLLHVDDHALRMAVVVMGRGRVLPRLYAPLALGRLLQGGMVAKPIDTPAHDREAVRVRGHPLVEDTVRLLAPVWT